MTAREKVAQLLALARSTPFAGERETAVRLARTLFNKHRIADARLRWELLTALRLEAGPEPAPSQSPPAPAMPEETEWGWWAEWMAAEQADQERGTREGMKRRRRQQKTTRAGQNARGRPRAETNSGSRGTPRHRRKRVWVRGHTSVRSFRRIPGYTREIATRPVMFTCTWCQDTVTQQRFPGPLPAYCSEGCKKEAQREQTRERVRRYRERQR